MFGVERPYAERSIQTAPTRRARDRRPAVGLELLGNIGSGLGFGVPSCQFEPERLQRCARDGRAQPNNSAGSCRQRARPAGLGPADAAIRSQAMDKKMVDKSSKKTVDLEQISTTTEGGWARVDNVPPEELASRQNFDRGSLHEKTRRLVRALAHAEQNNRRAEGVDQLHQARHAPGPGQGEEGRAQLQAMINEEGARVTADSDRRSNRSGAGLPLGQAGLGVDRRRSRMQTFNSRACGSAWSRSSE